VIGFDGTGVVFEMASGRELGHLTIKAEHPLDPAHAHYLWSLYNPATAPTVR
jgi:hypothetical protein